MKVDVVMPKMGESLQEGTIIKWLKGVGDKIERDEMILEISTDKVDTEVPAPVSGTIVEITAQENETIEVGKVIAYIETESLGEAKPTEKVDSNVKIETPSSNNTTPHPASNEPEPEMDSGDMIDVVMPKMGESLQEGTIIKWLKAAGDKIERDEMILEISTDKVDTEVPSPVSGTIAELLANEGDTIEVGKPIARISTGSSIQTSAKKSEPKQETKTVAESKPMETKSEQVAIKEPNQEFSQVQGNTYDIPRRKGEKFFSPLVRTIAKEKNVSLEELETIKGSGIDGRITKADLLDYIELKETQTKSAHNTTEASTATDSKQTSQSTAPRTISPASFGDDVEIIPMDRIRTLISEHMVYSKHTSAHVTSVSEADVTQIVKFRNKFKEEFLKREGIKLTYTPFFAKATIDGIKEFPMVNVSVDGKNIIRHNRINLGVATALPDNNLIVPVIKNSDALSLTGLQRSVTDLANRARNRKLNPDEIQGGTFTITNIGTAGTLFGSPIINQPECAILGLGAIKKRPVVKEVDGEYLIVIRDMMYISLTYDHRVVDGMLAGQALAAICRNLESMNEQTITL